MTTKPFGIAVSALIRDDEGRILLLKRSTDSNHFAGEWEPPGGKIDSGESFDQALIREVLEETGLDIALDGVAGITEFEIPKIRVVLIHMKAHIVSGKIQLSDEHEDYVWLLPEQFPSKQLAPKIINFREFSIL